MTKSLYPLCVISDSVVTSWIKLLWTKALKQASNWLFKCVLLLQIIYFTKYYGKCLFLVLTTPATTSNKQAEMWLQILTQTAVGVSVPQ